MRGTYIIQKQMILLVELMTINSKKGRGRFGSNFATVRIDAKSPQNSECSKLKAVGRCVLSRRLVGQSLTFMLVPRPTDERRRKMWMALTVSQAWPAEAMIYFADNLHFFLTKMGFALSFYLTWMYLFSNPESVIVLTCKIQLIQAAHCDGNLFAALLLLLQLLLLLLILLSSDLSEDCVP